MFWKYVANLQENTLCQSAISIKLLRDFFETALRHGCSPVNLLHIFWTSFQKNTSRWLRRYYRLCSHDKRITHRCFCKVWKMFIAVQRGEFRIKNGAFRFHLFFGLFLFFIFIIKFVFIYYLHFSFFFFFFWWSIKFLQQNINQLEHGVITPWLEAGIGSPKLSVELYVKLFLSAVSNDVTGQRKNPRHVFCWLLSRPKNYRNSLSLSLKQNRGYETITSKNISINNHSTIKAILFWKEQKTFDICTHLFLDWIWRDTT